VHTTPPNLQAARNEIGTLPPCLSFCGLKFPRLESLELRGVDLTFIEMKDWEFPQLMSLEVHHCYAGGIGTSCVLHSHSHVEGLVIFLFCLLLVCIAAAIAE
jgi:hypothetical protein